MNKSQSHPPAPTNNVRDMMPRNIKLLSQFILSKFSIGISRSNLKNIGFAQSRLSVLLSSWTGVTTFSTSVLDIFLQRTKPQMQGVNTKSIVTRVADAQFTRITAVIQKISQTVTPIIGGSAGVKVFSVATRGASALPLPTPVGTEKNIVVFPFTKLNRDRQWDRFMSSHFVFTSVENILVRLGESVSALRRAVLILPREVTI